VSWPRVAFLPRLEGRAPAYLLKRLRDIRSGARRDDTMGLIACALDEGTGVDIVAWFGASRPASRLAGPHVPCLVHQLQAYAAGTHRNSTQPAMARAAGP
jgi:cytochrome c553